MAGASGDTARKPFGVSVLLLAVTASSAETNQVQVDGVQCLEVMLFPQDNWCMTNKS